MNVRVGLTLASAGISLTALTAPPAQASLIVGAPVPLADQDAPQEIVVMGTKASREAQDNKVVCKMQNRMSSRFLEKNCRTHRQWESLRYETMRAAHEIIDRPLISPQ